MITLKTTIDKRTGVFVRTVQTTVDTVGPLGRGIARTNRFRIFGNFSLPMYLLGQYALSVMKARVLKGIGSDDQPMKPLSTGRSSRVSRSGQVVEFNTTGSGYLRRKQRLGGKPIRDLFLTGAMLENFQIRSVSETQVRMDITSSIQRVKARANEDRSPWFGFSVRDMAAIAVAGERILGQQIGDVGVGFGGGRPQWLDPLGMQQQPRFPASMASTGRLAA